MPIPKGEPAPPLGQGERHGRDSRLPAFARAVKGTTRLTGTGGNVNEFKVFNPQRTKAPLALNRRRLLMLSSLLGAGVLYGAWSWGRGPRVEERLATDPDATSFIYRDGWIVPV